MGFVYLSIELFFDFMVFLSGLILIFRSKDNYQKFYWGVMSSIIGGVFIWENVGWLLMITDDPSYRFTDLLNIEKMLKWYLPASLICLFPTASLRPGYLTPVKVLGSLIVPVIVITTGINYLIFNGTTTRLDSFSDIVVNWHNMDVRLRIFIFVFSIVTPLFHSLYPILRMKKCEEKEVFRKINHNMYLFVGFMYVFLVIYIFFTLCINEFVFNLFGITAVVFTLTFSIQYMIYENPFTTSQTEDITSVKVTLNPLFTIVEEKMSAEHPFTNKDYNIHDLSDTLDISEKVISEAIKSAGYTGFREYICNLRLDYFKKLAEENPDSNVKELMFRCGFTSRSTFYRNFTEKFGVSPLAFLNK